MTNDGMMLLQKNNKHAADTDNDDGNCHDRFLTLFSVLNSQTSYKLSKRFLFFSLQNSKTKFDILLTQSMFMHDACTLFTSQF